MTLPYPKQRLTLLYIASIVAAAAILIVFPKWTVDDAFITYRYAANLADEGELNWNVGDDPVEGYTGVLLPVVLAGGMKIGAPPLELSKAIGIASLFISALALWLILRALRIAEPIPALAVLFYLNAPLMFTHAYSGLETVLFNAAIMGSIYAFTVCVDGNGARGAKEACLGFLLLLAGLTRPEGVALAFVLVAALLWIRWAEGPRSSARTALWLFITLFVPGLVYFIWRANYYGHLMPNTFHAKSYPGPFNFGSLKRLLRFYGLYLTIPSLAVAALHLRSTKQPITAGVRAWFSGLPRLPRILFIVCIAFMTIVTLQYCRSALIMNFSHRFYVVFLPLLLLCLAIVGDSGLKNLVNAARTSKGGPRPLKQFLILAAAVQTVLYAGLLGYEIREAHRSRIRSDSLRLPAADYLLATLPPDESIIVCIDAGRVPYLTGFRTIDFGGLNDEKLGREGLSDREKADYFFEVNAGAAVFTSYDWERVVHTPPSNAVVGDARFGRYILGKKFRPDPGGDNRPYFYFVYLRKDLAESSGGV